MTCFAIHASADAQSADEVTAWTTYRHPTGAYIEHPQSWSTQETQFGIALVPPDFDPNAEVIIALGESAAGLSGADDPQVGQYFDVLMSQIAPGMRRSGQTSAIDYRAGKGTLYEYEGSLNKGQSAKAQFRAAILFSQAVAIAIIATEEKMRSRGPVVERIFSSLGQAQPERDPALVGAWLTSSTESDYSSSGSVFFRTDSVYSLTADGRLTSRSRTQGSVTGGAGGTAVRSTDEQSAGTWSGANGRVFIFWDEGGTSSGSYEAAGNGMTVRLDGAEQPLRLERAR